VTLPRTPVGPIVPSAPPATPHSDDATEMLNSMLFTFAEGLFVLLPLVVLVIVSLYSSASVRTLFGNAEWSFAASVLTGQTIVKFISGIMRHGRPIWERVALLVSCMLVLGLVPSLIVLSLVLTGATPPLGLIWAQIGLFVLALGVYFVFGTMGHYGLFARRLPN
jgi:hypothetical protein